MSEPTYEELKARLSQLEKEITDYFKLFDYDIAKLKQAFDSTH